MNVSKENPRAVLMDEFVKLAKSNPKIVAVSCDSANGGFIKFKKEFPDRFIECAIAEQSAVGISAGLAKMGFVPFLMAITPFITMRNYEQIRDDIGYTNMNVKLIGSGAGVSYSTLGYTHEAIEDVALMNTIPNMTIFAPGDSYDVKECIRLANQIYGPVYIRMPLQPLFENAPAHTRKYEVGNIEIIREGEDAVIITYGAAVNQAVIASEILKDNGISVAVASLGTVKPLDSAKIVALSKKYPAIFTLEEHKATCGLGSMIATVLSSQKNTGKIIMMGLPEDKTIVTGPYDEVLEFYGISGKEVAAKIIKNLKYD